MVTPRRGALRAVRSVVLSIFVLGLSAGAHALGGGHLPGAEVLAAMGAAALLTCALATRWRLPAAAVTGLLATGQVVLHEAFMAAAPPMAHAVSATEVSATDPSSSDTTMLLAHAAAAVALAFVYSRGEAALWALCAWLVPLAALVLALSTPVAVASGPRRALTHSLLPSPCHDILRSVQRRGPPRPHAC